MYAINIYAWLSNFGHFIECYEYFLIFGVFTNLCCKTADVRKRQWIIPKNKINRLINQLIDQSVQ